MNEPVTLTVSGYAWTCPVCGKPNYNNQVGAQVTCSGCSKQIAVERVIHKIGNSPGQITIQAAGYSFQCPECRETVFVGEVTKDVTCKVCHAVMRVEWLKHKIDSTVPVPTGEPVQITEKGPEPVLPAPITNQVEMIIQAKVPKAEIPEVKNKDQLSFAL